MSGPIVKKIEEIVDKRVDEFITNATTNLLQKVNAILDKKPIDEIVDQLIIKESDLLKQVLIKDINELIEREFNNGNKCNIN